MVLCAHSPHPVGAGFHARPALVDGRRYCAAPTLHQPLSHGALRRDSSPFRGAEGWVEVCGVYASVYRDADTYVSLLPVRGGVLDAPRSRDRRGGLDTAVRLDRLRPHFPRCDRLASITQRIRSRGHSPRTFCVARRSELSVSVDRRRGVGDAAPYGRSVYFALPHTT